jgi:hypothetical protein
MSRRWSLIAAYLLFLFIPFTQTPGAVQGIRNRPGHAEIELRRRLFQQIVADGEIDQKLCVENGEIDPVRLLTTERVDLNEDGAPEIQIEGEGCACQGARRCMQWFYRKSGDGYELLASIPAAEQITLLKTSTNGYRDLRVSYPSGANYAGWDVVFKFDGRRYRDPKAPPAQNRVGSASTGQSAAAVNQPPLPFEDPGACPFECCTYRRWSVTAPISVRQDRSLNSPVVFSLRRGESVVGVTGVVVTTAPGQARVLKSMTVGGVRVRSGETVSLLTNVGEGHYKVWYRGKIEELPVLGSVDFKILKEPQYVWWVKVKNSKGRIGWTDQTRNFHGMDSCG